jgi:hypothetical protein
MKMSSDHMHMEGRSHSIGHRGRLITAEDVSLPIIPVDAGSVMLGPAVVGSVGSPVDIVRVVVVRLNVPRPPVVPGRVVGHVGCLLGIVSVRRSSSPRVSAQGSPSLLDLKKRSWAGRRGCFLFCQGASVVDREREREARGVEGMRIRHSSTVIAKDAYSRRGLLRHTARLCHEGGE